MKLSINRLKPYFNGITPELWRKHLIYLFLTLVSTTVTYYSFSSGITEASKIFSSLGYSIALIMILLSHEMGHYLHARKYSVTTTLPYFLPFPFLSPFGTLGAFIKMKTLPPNKRALFDISFWGPGMSFLVSLPFTILGLLFSTTAVSKYGADGFLVGKSGLVFGKSIIFDVLSRYLITLPEGHSIVLHPLAFAGWVGFFVTAINLFPIGQLDGGHIAYVFLGKRQKNIGYAFLAILIILAATVSTGWVLWIFLLIAMGIRHPVIRMQEPESLPLDIQRARLGLSAAMIFIICFIPEPLKNLHNFEKIENNDKQELHMPSWKNPLLQQIKFELRG
jgi:membrane-associated protease RseP (regulator of RpoE activity)